MNSPEIQEFVAQIALHMEMNTPRIEKALAELSEEELWLRPNDHSNSVGNLLLHLCGNIRQYILASLKGEADSRIRDEEFAAQGGYSKETLFAKLHDTVTQAVAVIRAARSEELLRVRGVQGFQMSGIAIAIHVCEHYSYHTGQIAFWVKLLKNKDLGYYSGVNLNAKNHR